jgi:hypothetical protein
MRRVTGFLGGAAALLLFGCASRGVVAGDQESSSAQFLGSTPCDDRVREFLGGLGTNTPCHYIMWQISFTTNRNTDLPATFNLVARYRVPTQSNTNQSEDGPQVALQGKWEILQGTPSRPGASVYRLSAEKPQRSLSFVKINEHLLHVLDPDGSLLIGNGGWSYTLNHADHAEPAVEASLAMSAPDMSYKIAPLATGPAVFAVFEGRTPCHGIARDLRMPQHAGCMKAKWRVTLYQNPETSAPTTYKVEGTLYREGAGEGAWKMTRGAKPHSDANVYRLDPSGTGTALFLWGADENVLFFLNQNREPLVGNSEFSYTLNQVVRK